MVQQFVEVLRCETSARVYSLTVDVGVGVAVIVRVGDAEEVGVGVGVADTETVGDAIDEAVGVAVAFGATLIVTPLLQTLFVPCLMHLNSFPPEITTAPNFLQVAPALGVTALATPKFEKKKLKAISRKKGRRIRES